MENLIHSIITLDNQEKYIVLNQATYQGNSYYFVAKVTDNEEDIVEESGEKRVQLVKDEKIIALLTKYFQKEETE